MPSPTFRRPPSISSTERINSSLTQSVCVCQRESRRSQGCRKKKEIDSSAVCGLICGGMRNRIAHGYLDVDPQVVQRTVANEVPALIRVINRELGR
ncbi:DUF86 domain-containing protein [Brevibacterium luteolum]|uniref:HepT-like ribonuclease domain-containing protein n=1 Tax=Brevibacterium luteolum TaxID=199591 RepID=UPI00349FC60B